MPKAREKRSAGAIEDPHLAAKRRKPVPHEFVLDALAELAPRTNPMFGCLAIYVGEKIVLILRDKASNAADNGVWLATTEEHHTSLRREFPHMRSVGVLGGVPGKKVTGWQVLPADAPDFEEAAMHACELVIEGDTRIGKVPGARRKRKAGVQEKTKARPAARKPTENRKRR
jgi:hypothetical protein